MIWNKRSSLRDRFMNLLKLNILLSISMHPSHLKRHILRKAFLPSASVACVPTYRGALRRDVAQRLLIVPLDAGVGHPGQNQSGAQALIFLRVHTQVACRGGHKSVIE